MFFRLRVSKNAVILGLIIFDIFILNKLRWLKINIIYLISLLILSLLLINFKSGIINNIESSAVFRILLSFVLTVFLFAGLIGTASVLINHSDLKAQNVIAQVSEKKDTRLSIKEIESITASDNFRFTSENALR